MKNKILILIIVGILLVVAVEGVFGIPAFPGAEGFGAGSVGGRGGQVIKVTNLNDNGIGSFRTAVIASGPRIVVFEVSGIINLESDIYIYNPYLTIAGQTSPGGILITGRQTTINTHDVIMQHMRFRVGSHRILDGADPETLDSFDIWGAYWGSNSAYNIIIDHCSFGWGVDESISVTGGVLNATIQWSIVSEGLSHAGHPKGEHSKGLLVSGKYVYPSSVSLHHNYFAHNTERNPQIYSPEGVDTLADVVNNVVYNFNGCLPMDSGGSTRVNWVHNYVKEGRDSNDFCFEAIYQNALSTPEPLIYVLGNIGCKRLDQSYPQWFVGESYRDILLDEAWRQYTPWLVSPTTTIEMSYDYALEILETVGATKPVRDSVDARVIGDFVPGTGDIIDDVTYPNDFPTFSTPSPPTDNDNDGMADSWELLQGLNTAVDDSAGDLDGDGYTNIEEYLHYLSGDVPSTPECSDSIDNDGDGQTDYPDDAGCTSLDDDDETNCGDGVCEGGENCGTCPADCPIGAGQICCSGILYSGDCCGNSDCTLPETCNNHICSEPTQIPGICEDLNLLMHLDEDSSVIQDFSGNGNDGTCSEGSCPTWTSSGKFSGAFDFDGSDDRIDAGSGSSLDDLHNTGLTISAWVNFNTYGESDVNSIVAKNAVTSIAGRWYFGIDRDYSPGSLRFFKDYDTTDLSTTSQGSVGIGTWHHIVVTWNGGNDANADLAFYIDGSNSPVSGSDASGNPVSDASLSLYIGSETYLSRTIDGIIDEVAIWNRTLSSQEVLDLYNGGPISCEASTCSSGADLPPYDNVVDITELMSYIADWKAGSVTIIDLMTAIGEWKNGC